MYNAQGELVDPWDGECNDFNEATWWVNQQAYYEPRINHISTHSAIAGMPCGEVEQAQEAYNFYNGDTLFVRLWLRDIQVGNTTDLRLTGPGGENIVEWSWENTWPAAYATADAYWYYVINESWPSGIYQFQADYYGQTYQTEFSVGTNSGVEEARETGISIYPNPAIETIHINGLHKGGKNRVRIIDPIGKEIMNQRVSAANLSLHTKGLAAGIYLVYIEQGNSAVIKRVAVSR